MKRYITIVLLIIANVITIYVFCHWDIHKIRQDYRERKARAEEYNMMHEKRCELDTLSVTDDDSTAWYNKYHVIAHGGGGVSGKCYTNSIESWDYSYSKGIRVIDADVRFTSDSILVLRHYWGDNLELNDTRMGDSHLWLDNNGHMQYLVEENVLDYNSFINGKEFFIFTPMSVLDMLNYMSSHEDLYVSIDAKNKRDNNYNIYSKLVELAFENKASHLLDRCIANFYSFEDYYNVMRLYPFKNIVMRQYAEWPQNYYDLVSFCKKNDIHVVNITKKYIEDEGLQLMIDNGLYVYVATCDYLSDYEYYIEKGCSGVISNYLNEDILNSYKKQQCQNR